MYTIAILGYGGRGRNYARICRSMSDGYALKAVIDISPEKLTLAKSDNNLSDDMLFLSLDEFVKRDKMCDYVFVCTQDKDHIDHALPLIDKGYNLLLEKPIACSVEDCLSIESAAKTKGVDVSICHVLRYSTYYAKIKKIMDSGALGKIIAIEQVENVGYWHQAHSYVRGDWRIAAESNPMILAKCCHDLDIAVFLADSKCKYVTSVGRNTYFNKEHAPKGATEYCVGGCKAKTDCPYDAEKLYIGRLKHLPKSVYKNFWPQSRLMSDSIVTKPKLREAIAKTRYGKCVFLSDNDVVDYQTTNMEFENGIFSSLTMTAFSDGSYRQTRIRGSLAELVCNMHTGEMRLENYGGKHNNVNKGRKVWDGHGGGDRGLVAALAKGELKTDITMSIQSHIIGFAAEESRKKCGTSIDIAQFRREHEPKNNK